MSRSSKSTFGAFSAPGIAAAMFVYHQEQARTEQTLLGLDNIRTIMKLKLVQERLAVMPPQQAHGIRQTLL